MRSEVGSLAGASQHGQQGGAGHQGRQGPGADGPALVFIAEHGEHTDYGKNSR